MKLMLSCNSESWGKKRGTNNDKDQEKEKNEEEEMMQKCHDERFFSVIIAYVFHKHVYFRTIRYIDNTHYIKIIYCSQI